MFTRVTVADGDEQVDEFPALDRQRAQTTLDTSDPGGPPCHQIPAHLGPESDGLVIDLSDPQLQFAAVDIRLGAVGFAGGDHNYRETLSRLASGG